MYPASTNNTIKFLKQAMDYPLPVKQNPQQYAITAVEEKKR